MKLWYLIVFYFLSDARRDPEGFSFSQTSDLASLLDDVNCTQILAEDTVNSTIVIISDTLEPLVLDLFHINVDNDKGYVIEAKEKVGEFRYTCERWNVSWIKMNNDAVLGIYDRDDLWHIEGGEILIGPDNEAVWTYVSQPNCEECFAYYFLTSVSGIQNQRLKEDAYLRGTGDMSAAYSVWPSPTSFISCLLGNVLFLADSFEDTPTRVVVLYHAETEDAIRFLFEMAKEFRKTNIQVKIIDLTSVLSLAFMKQLRPNELASVFTSIRTEIHERQTKAVVLYMDARTVEFKLKALKILFSKGTQLDQPGPQWLMADMEILFDPFAFEEIQKLDLVSVSIHFLRPCLVFDDTGTEDLIEYCMFDVRRPGVKNEGFMAARSLLQSIMDAKSKHGEHKPNIVLSEFMQTICPEDTMITWTMRVELPWLECKQSADNKTVRRVGFPKRDMIVTRTLIPEIKGLPATAMYLPKTMFDERETYEEHRRVQDYVVYGSKPTKQQEYVVVVKERPFVIGGSKPGEYSGLCIDIYKAVALKLAERGIILDVRIFEAGFYGALDPDGQWTGAFGYLSADYYYDAKIVLGLGQFSVTNQRLEDPRFIFSPVFAQASLTYMTRKVSSPSLFQFLRPFSSGVWMLLMVVFILSGAYLRIIQAWNPFREEVPEESVFNWKESLWHSYLIVTQIGAPFGAVHLPSRVFSFAYWFFAVVVVGCYTGNLAGFLSENRFAVPSLGKMVNEMGYRFGMLTNSSFSEAFISNILSSRGGSLNLDPRKHDLVDSYDVGVEKVRQEKFILVGTSLVMKHYEHTDEDCGISVHEDPTFYGKKIEALAFPMRRDWKHAKDFIWAMAKLKESGELQLLYRKWIFSDKNCEGAGDDEEDHIQLDFVNFVGLYILLSAGIVVSFLFLAFKLIHLKLREGKDPNDNRKENADDEERESLRETQA